MNHHTTELRLRQFRCAIEAFVARRGGFCFARAVRLLSDGLLVMTASGYEGELLFFDWIIPYSEPVPDDSQPYNQLFCYGEDGFLLWVESTSKGRWMRWDGYEHN